MTASRDYHTYAAISVEATNRTSLAGYLNHVIDQYSRIPRFSKTGSNNNAILAGSPAYILENSDLGPGYPVKAVEVGTIIGDKAYFISYVTDPKTYSVYLPSVYAMIKSLSISSGNTLQNPVGPVQNNLSRSLNNLPPGGPGAIGSIPK